VKLETFSYVPPLTTEQVVAQIQHILRQRLVPVIEFVREPEPHNHYWNMWKLPMFDARSPDEVLGELQACKAARPECFIKLIGYDRHRQVQAVSFVVHRPR